MQGHAPARGGTGQGRLGGGVAVRVGCPHRLPPGLGEPRARTCTNTRLSAGTSNGPARRGKASSASDSSRLKRGRRSLGPGAAGNGDTGREKWWHRGRRMRCPLGPLGK